MKPSLFQVESSIDARGRIDYAEYEKSLPFLPVRIFVISQVPEQAVRGRHAHSTTSQVLICVSGSVSAKFTGRSGESDFVLSNSSGWLQVPPMNFGELTNFSTDCVLVVLASEKYDPDEYISDFEEFLAKLESQA